jgi:colicin import membrane protein
MKVSTIEKTSVIGVIDRHGELTRIDKHEIQSYFTEQGKIDPILEKIANDARSIIADVSTANGRKEIASVAYRVAQSKTYLDGLGKDLVADMKELPKKVDASRKQVRDFLDALKDEVRKPLDDWEAEQAKIEAQRVADKKAEQFHADAVEHEAWFDSVIAQDWDLAILADQIFNHEQEDKRKAKEQAQRERDTALVQEASERAKKEAEAAAQADKDAAAQREREALLAKERAEQETARAAQALKDAEAQAAQDKLDAEQRAIDAKAAADKALKDAEYAAELKAHQVAESERLRVAEIATRLQAKADADKKKEDDRKANVEHRKTVNNAALKSLVEQCGLTEEQAKKVVIAIASGSISNVHIEY